MKRNQWLTTPRLWLLILVGTGLLIGMLLLLKVVLPPIKSGLLVYADGEWHALTSPIPYNPTLVRVSDGDDIWILTQNTLYRADRFHAGRLWRHYEVQEGDTINSITRHFGITRYLLLKNNTGIKNDADLTVGALLWIPQAELIRELNEHVPSIGKRFIVVDRTVWAASDTALFYYNGQVWERSEHWATMPLLGLTTDGTYLWYLDSGYQLVRFLRDDVQTFLLADMGFDDVKPRLGAPVLVGLKGGPIFIVGDYLLRVDTDGTFSRQLTAANQLYYLGVVDNELWLVVDGRLQISGDGEHWRSQALPTALAYYGAGIDTKGQTWLAAHNGIWMQPRNGEWRHILKTEQPVTSLTLGNNGQLWATTTAESRPVYGIVLLLGVLCGALALGATLMGLLLVVTFRAVHNPHARQVLEANLPDLAPSQQLSEWEKGWRKWVMKGMPIALVALLAFAVLITEGVGGFGEIKKQVDTLANSLWPDSPEWFPAFVYDVLLSLLLFVAGLPFVLWAIWRTKEPEKRQRLRRSLILGGIVLLVYPFLTNFAQYGAESMTDSTFIKLIGIVVVLLVGLVVALSFATAINTRDVRLGRYEKIIREAQQTQQLPQVMAQARFMSGTKLMLIGRYAEAEPLLRRCVIDSDNLPLLRANLYSVLENLGQTLTGLGRYEEAAKSLQASIELRPKGSWAYARLAENLLFQGKDAESALELLATAERNKRGSLSGRMADKFLWSEIAADRAWALALLRRHLEADGAIEQALRTLPTPFQPIEGGVYWRLGEVMRLRKDRKQAQAYWEKSLAIDPDGPFSQRAQTSLEMLRTEGVW